MPAMKCVKLIKRHILYINVIIENVTSGFLAFGYLNINGNETYIHSFISTAVSYTHLTLPTILRV